MISSFARAASFTVALLAMFPAFAEQPKKTPNLLSSSVATSREPTANSLALAIYQPVFEISTASEFVQISPFARQQMLGPPKAKTRYVSAELGDLTLSIAAINSRSVRLNGPSNFVPVRFSSLAANASIETPLNPHDAIGITASWTRERRRPSVQIDAHNKFRTNDRAITFSWIRDNGLRLSLSAFSIQPSRTLSATEYLVAVAAGSPRTTRGLGLEFANAPTHDPAKLNFGFAVRQQSTKANFADHQSLYRPETYAAFFVRSNF